MNNNIKNNHLFSDFSMSGGAKHGTLSTEVQKNKMKTKYMPAT